MSGRDFEVEELRHLEPAAWAPYLTARSGLPGPRANLALAAAVADVADPTVIEHLLGDGGEYPAMCAAAAAGRRAAESSARTLAHRLAADERWRVREGVALGLQLLGDGAPEALTDIVSEWVDDQDPLVQRAALAAICEPRLLRTPEMAAAGREACRRATEHLVALAPERRRSADARTLRQALGYCWSVVVAADPGHGVPVFTGLDTTDPDVAWIVAENRRKKRLSALL